MIGIVVAHGGREPGSHIFRPEVDELERTPPSRCSGRRSTSWFAAARRGSASTGTAGMGTGIRPVPWDPLPFVRQPGPARLFQQGIHDDVIPYAAARALFEAAAEPKEWREYDCDHGVDGHPQARLDRYAFLERTLS